MKNRDSSKSKLLSILHTLIFVFFISLAANAQDNPTSFRLIAPGLVAQGQSFTGTVVEETDNGPIPLKQGSQVSVMGEIVEVGKHGKVEVPTCPDFSGTYPIGANIVSIPGTNETISNTTIFSEPVTSIPVSNIAAPVTEIWTTSDIVGPGKVITVEGTNLNSLSDEVLIGNNGETIELTELSSSFFESQYVVADPDFPQGEYHFYAEDDMGYIHISEDVSLNPTFEMAGPALKRVGQKGKITIKTDGEGVITLSGGLPIIELHPTGDMNVINSDAGSTLMIPTEGDGVISIPFTAQQVGQYTVTADLHSENDLPEELLGDAVSLNQQPVESEYDPVTNETTVTSPVEVLGADGTPLANTTVEGVISNPVNPEHITTTTDASGIANISTVIPGQVSGSDVSVHILNITGHPILQDGENFQEGDCNNEEPVQDGNADEDVSDSYADVLRENKETWGNYQGICGTGLMEMARNHPQAYADFLETEQQIEDWLNGEGNQDENNNQDGNDSEESVNLDDEMRDIYEENKRRWGNYQGICGTALMEMARLYPDLYQDFLDNEQRIEDMLNGEDDEGENGNQEENGSEESADLDDAMREIYEENKKKWGNYQGICGTALMEMAQFYPDLYQDFLDNEQRIEDMLNGEDNEGENGSQEENGSGESADLDDETRKIYEENKRRWGNYQGICGTALLEMARNYPKLYQEFLDNEKRIEDMLNDD